MKIDKNVLKVFFYTKNVFLSQFSVIKSIQKTANIVVFPGADFRSVGGKEFQKKNLELNFLELNFSGTKFSGINLFCVLFCPAGPKNYVFRTFRHDLLHFASDWVTKN